MTTQKSAQVQPETAEQNGGDAVLTDVFPDFAITLDEANRRVRMLQEYVREHMTEGEDFGVIPGTSKPTLFKPGAEKLNAIFGLAPMMEVTNRLEDWERGFVSYEVKVTLINKRTGTVEAEGVGACNSAERRYRTQDAANIANTILKMSKKRALIDATLSATRASGLFTQDLEDLDIEQMNRDQRAPQMVAGGRSNGSRNESVRAVTPRENNREQNTERAEPTEHRFVPASEVQPHNSNVLTDAQHRAILAIANRVFGHAATAEDFATIVDKPVEQLSKSDASALIDRLRFMLAEQQSPGARESGALNRSSRYNQREALAA